MPRTYKTEAIIIKHVKFNEADYLLTVLSKRYGKIVFLAKGIRKINSRKAPHLEMFNRIFVLVARGKNLDIVVDVFPLEIYPYLRSRLDRVAQAYRAVELINRLIPEKEEHIEVYILLTKILQELNLKRVLDINMIVEDYSLALLWELGYLPKGQRMSKGDMDTYLEKIMEKKIYSNNLLTKLALTVK